VLTFPIWQVLRVLVAMFTDNTPLRHQLDESHISAIVKIMVARIGGEKMSQYVTFLRHLTKYHGVTIRHLQVAIMNQLMLPDHYDVLVKPVFDAEIRNNMLEERSWDEKYHFSVRLIKLLVVCCENNEAARTQCRSIIRCRDICTFLKTDPYPAKDFVPNRMQRMYTNFLRAAYVEDPQKTRV
jgi:hypothetical protein